MFPLGDIDQGRGAGRGRRARARGRRQAGLPRHLLHRRRRHPRLPGRAARRAARRGRRRRDRRRRWARTTARSGSPSGSGTGCASRPAADGGPATSCRSSRDEHGHVGTGRPRSTSRGASPSARSGPGAATGARSLHGAAARARHGSRPRHGERDRRSVARLARPQRGVAAGQALVMYDGDRVLGSATITAAHAGTPCRPA